MLPLRLASLTALGFSLGLLGEIGSDYWLYIHWLIPKLPHYQSVPAHIWIIVFAPRLIACIISGAISRKFTSYIVTLLGTSLGSLAYGYWAAHSMLPGHDKSWAIEAPAIWYWTVGLGIQFIIFFIPSFLSYLTRRFLIPTKQCPV